jgi:hypothetical protein
MSGKHGHQRHIANGAMRSHFVVVLAPKFDLLPGIVKVHEPMLVQASPLPQGKGAGRGALLQLSLLHPSHLRCRHTIYFSSL